MAISDVLGLFASPQQYAAQQAAAEQNRAINFAGLDPRQQANYGVFLGAQQLGRGLAGLFGAEDPQLRMISQRQQIMQSINPADPESLLSGIQRATEMGDQQLALTLTDYRNRQMSEMAQAAQRMAAANRERQQSIPADIAKAREIGLLTTAVAELEKTPQTPERDQQIAMLRTQLSALERPEKITPDMANAMALADLASADRNSETWKTTYQQQLTRLTTKPETEKKSAFAQQLEDAGYVPGSPAFVSKMDEFISKEVKGREGAGVSFGTDREAIAAEMYGKPFKDLTQAEKAAVNRRKEAEEGSKAERGATKLIMPGQSKEGPKGISGFRNEVIQSVKPFRDTVTATDNALQNIGDAIKTGNFISFNAARVQLAKALGDSTLSRRDIEQAGGDPSLIGGFFDATSTLFTGTPTVDTQRKIQSTLKAIRKVARTKANAELDVQRKLGRRAGYEPEDMETAFDFPEFKREGPPAAPPGGKKTVDFNALPK